MKNKPIELRQSRETGDIITDYFVFLKQNFKSYFNIFIRYNGLFIIAFLGISYLLTTGFIGLITDDVSGLGMFGYNHEIPLYIGGFLFFIFAIITTILNYSLAASYTIHYVSSQGKPVEPHDVWRLVKKKLGKTLWFLIMIFIIYISITIIGVLISLIPVAGIIGYYLLMLGYTAGAGISFTILFHSDTTVTDAMFEGWNFVSNNFWKAVLSNFVITFLIGIMMLFVMAIPGMLIGFYTFHISETNPDLAYSPISIAIWVLGLTLLMVLFFINQSLIQFINGIIYFTIYEETYNEAARERIEEIGNLD